MKTVDALEVAIQGCEAMGGRVDSEHYSKRYAEAATTLRVHRDRLNELAGRVAEIEADSRYKAPPAPYQVNGPLALIQVSMKATVQAYRSLIAP